MNNTRGNRTRKAEVTNCARNCSIEKGNASANADIAEVDEVNDGFHYGLLLLVIPLFLMFSAGRKLVELPI